MNERGSIAMRPSRFSGPFRRVSRAQRNTPLTAFVRTNGRLRSQRDLSPPFIAHRAFTLLEVLIAIGLLVALSAAMFGFLFDMLASRAAAIEAARQQSAATTLIERIETDLQSCLAGDRRLGAGIRGRVDHLRILARGVAASLAERGAQSPEVFGDLQFTECRFDSDLKRVEMRRGPVNPQASASTAASATRDSSGPSFESLEGTIHKLRFRYHDGEQWRSTFDSLSVGRLPQAIEIAIWLNPLPGESVESEDADDALRFSDAQSDADAFAADEAELAFTAVAADPAEDDLPPPDRLRVILIPDAGVQGQTAHGE